MIHGLLSNTTLIKSVLQQQIEVNIMFFHITPFDKIKWNWKVHQYPIMLTSDKVLSSFFLLMK